MSFRRTAARLLAPPLIAAVLAVHVEGCAGTGAGPRSISEPYGGGAARHRQMLRVAKNSEIELTRRDGVVQRGRFRGIARMSDAEYARHWAEVAAESANADSILAPGSWITIQSRRGEGRHVRFRGYGFHVLEVQNGIDAPEQVRFDRLAAVSADNGSAWTGKELSAAAVSGRLPMFSVIRLGVGSGEVAVPVDQVAQISTRTTAGDVLTGTLVILGVTAVLLVVIAATYDPYSGCEDINLPSGWGSP